MRKKISNPILKGFHPDPSILRVGSTYYVANSTFEWYPGVRIYESWDLIQWRFAAAPLDRFSLLDLRGIGSSEGIWAPDLSYCDGTYYLVYTIVRNQGRIKDTHNYLVTAPSVKGPWSEPVYLNSSGFDPSLFHDADGKKWLVNMVWDYRKKPGLEAFAGIVLQEYDMEEKCLTGKPVTIFQGTSLGFTEGPHIYRHEGYYYLMCAEGGTSYTHAVTMARSRTLTGEYQVDPKNPMLTSESGDLLQKAGHASLVETPEGEWYLAHLCARPLPGTKSCVLGRETGLQQVCWNEEGWLRLKNGGNHPSEWYLAETVQNRTEEETARQIYTFENTDFLCDFQTLRIPFEETGASLTQRPGWLRLIGREGITSRFFQGLVARRQTDFSFCATTRMEYEPECFQHSAGLIYRYNEENQYYLFVTWEEKTRTPLLCAVGFRDGCYQVIDQRAVSGTSFLLGIEVQETRGRFFYQEQGEKIDVGESFDVTNLSDDFTQGFTGAFVGICAQDLCNQKTYADFQWFCYEKI